MQQQQKQKWLKCRGALFGIALIFPFSLNAATSVTVSWQANMESDLSGYKIYYGTDSRNYSVIIDVGNTTDYPIEQLTVGQNYYFAVTAYDFNGNESAYSLEFPYLVQDIDPPTISSIVCEQNDLLRVVFSEPVEESSAELITNYSINNNVIIQSVVLQSDQRTVLIYTTIQANGEYTLTVNNVRDLASVPNTIASNSQVSYNWYGNDEIPPSVTLVELFRNSMSDLVVVTFSEALDQTSALESSNYSISPSVSIQGTGIDDSFKKIFLTTSSHTPNQNYTLTINNIKDGSNPPNTIPNNTQCFYDCIAEDSESPRLIAARLLSVTQLELEFSEGLDQVSATNVSNYTISPNVAISNASLSTDKSVVTLTTNAHQGGMYTITVSGVGDDATPSNMIASAQLQYTYTPPDLIAPTLQSVELINKSMLQLTFSEPVERNSALNVSNYLIQPYVQINQATLDVSETKVLLQTESHASGNYQITINGVKDQAEIPNTIAANTSTNYIYDEPDLTPPVVQVVQLHGANVIEVVFNESVDRTTGESVANYSIHPGVNINNASLVGDSLNRVFLETENHQPGQSYTLTVSGIKDRAVVPNIMPQSVQVVYDYPILDTTPPSLTSVILQGDRFLELSFSKSVDQIGAENTANYTISPSVSIEEATLDASLTKVFLKTGMHQPGTDYIIAVQNIQDRANPPNVIAENNQLTYRCESQDKVPPIVVMAELHGDDLLEIAFNEPVEINSAINKDNYIINNGITIYNVELSRQQTEVFLETSVHAAGSYTISVANIKDLAAIPNTITPQDIAYTCTPADTTPPLVMDVLVLDPNMVQVTFNEPLNRVSAENVANYGIDNGVTIESAMLDISGTRIILQTSMHVPGAYMITLNGLKDASSNSNPIASNTTRQYTYTTDDKISPEIVAAVLSSETILEVTFNERLDKASAENKDNYIINNNIEIRDVFLSSTNDVVIIETSNHAAGEYELTIHGIHDASPNKNEIEAYSQVKYIWNPDDNTPPELVSAQLMNNNYLELIFSEPISADESQNIENFNIEPPVTIYSAMLHFSLNKVYLNTAPHGEGKYSISVHNIQDRAFESNTIGSENRSDYSFTPPDTLPPGLISVQLSTPMSLSLVFNEALSRTSAEKISNYSISPNIEITNAYLLSSLTTVHLETAPHQGSVHYRITVNGIEDRSPIANRINVPVQRQYSFTPQDTVKPKLLSVKMHSANLLELVFNEPLEQNSAESRENYRIDPSGELENATLDTASLSRVFLETTTHMPGIGYSINVRNVKDRAPIPNSILQDTWISYSMPSAGGLSDYTPPAIARIEPMSSTKVDIVFTEPVNKNSVEKISNYYVDNSVSVQSAKLDENLVRVHLVTSAHQYGKPYTIQVKNVSDQANQPNVLSSTSPIKYFMTKDMAISDVSRMPYEMSFIQSGSLCYLDRDYIISEIPEKLENAIQITNLNDDKTSKGESFFSFEVRGDGILYIAYDKNIKQLPKWLSSWQATGEQIVNSHSSVYRLYSKSVYSGKIILGGNEGTMDDNMYLVFMVAYASSGNVLANLNRIAYQTEHLNVGDTYYIDRDYTLATIPKTLENHLWIRTANDDKLEQAEDFLQFTLNEDAIIYIGYDAKVKSLPEWLDDWDMTEEQIIDSRGTQFDIFSKEFEACEVTFGGNCASTDDNMYLILIESLGTGKQQDGYSTLPGYFTLAQNYPNPFNPETTIRYLVHKSGHIKLSVYNILGQRVKVLLDRDFDGAYEGEVIWDGTDYRGIPVASGIYFYRIQEAHFAKTRRMILMR